MPAISGWRAPVEVSACTSVTTRAGRSRSARLTWLDLERLSPWHLEPLHLAAEPTGYLCQPVTKEAVHAGKHRLTRLDQVGQRRFHGRGARTGDGQGQSVVGLEDHAQERLNVGQDGDELRVEMADQRGGHGAQEHEAEPCWGRGRGEARGWVEFVFDGWHAGLQARNVPSILDREAGPDNTPGRGTCAP